MSQNPQRFRPSAMHACLSNLTISTLALRNVFPKDINMASHKARKKLANHKWIHISVQNYWIQNKTDNTGDFVTLGLFSPRHHNKRPMALLEKTGPILFPEPTCFRSAVTEIIAVLENEVNGERFARVFKSTGVFELFTERMESVE